MPDFQIKISTPYEASGALSHLADLERQIGKAKALGASLENIQRLEKDRDGVRELIKNYNETELAVEKVVGVTGKAAESTRLVATESKEWQAAMAALGTQIPGLGFLSQALFSAWTLGIGAATLAVAGWVKELQEAEAAMRSFLDLQPEFRRHTDSIRHQADELHAARVEAAGFRDELVRVNEAQDKARAAAEQATKALREQAEAVNGLTTSEEKLFRRRLEDEVKAGNRTREQADQIIAQREYEDAVVKAAQERQREAEGIRAQEQELATARATVVTADQKVPELLDAQAIDRAAQKRAEEDLALARKVIDPAGEVQKVFREREAAYQDFVAQNPTAAAMSPEERAERLGSRRRELESLGQDPFMAADPEGRASAEVAIRAEIALLERFNELATHRERHLRSFEQAQQAVQTLPEEMVSREIAMQARQRDIDALRQGAVDARNRATVLPAEIETARQSFRTAEELRQRDLTARSELFGLESVERGQGPGARQMVRQAQDFYRAGQRELDRGQAARDAAAEAIQNLGAGFLRGFDAIMQAVAEQQRQLNALNQRVARNQPLK